MLLVFSLSYDESTSGGVVFLFDLFNWNLLYYNRFLESLTRRVPKEIVMLTFDLKKKPLTLAEIYDDKTRLEATLVKFERRVLIGKILLILVPITVVACLWQFELLPEKDSFAAAVTVAVAVAVTVAVALAGAVAGAIIAEERESVIREQISSLSFLDEVPNQARCPQIVAICKVDEDCEKYRLAVAQQGRALTLAEADMMERWANGAEVRKRHDEQLREQQVACALLKNSEVV